MNHKDISKMVEDEIKKEVKKKIAVAVKAKRKYFYKIVDEFLASKKFDAIAKKSIQDSIQYWIDDATLDDLMSTKDSKKFWNRVSKKILGMTK